MLIGVTGTVSGTSSDELHQTDIPSKNHFQTSPTETDCDISGPYQTAIEDGRTGEVRVIRPESLDDIEHPRETAETFAEVTYLFNVSDSAQNTTVGIVPPDNIEPWAYATGDDVCFRGVSDALWDGLMTHEYLHTRQEFETSAEMEWFVEASAFYYMALLPYARGSMSRSTANDRLAEPNLTNVSLDNSSLVLLNSQRYVVWGGRGPPVLAALDREIRLRTDGNKTLEHVIQEMNNDNREITYSVFQAIVSDVAGERMDAWLDTYITEYTPVGEEARIAGLTLTAPAANPEFEVVDVTLRDNQDEYDVTSGENLTVADDSHISLDLTVQNRGKAQVRHGLRVYITTQSNESILLGSRAATMPANETQTVRFTNQTRLESLAEISPGTHRLTLEVGSTTYNQTVTVETDQTANVSSTQDSDETEGERFEAGSTTDNQTETVEAGRTTSVSSAQESEETETARSGMEGSANPSENSDLPIDFWFVLCGGLIFLFSLMKARS